MCLICEKVNEKPSRLFEHLRKVDYDNAKKDYFQSSRHKFHAQSTLSTMFSTAAQQKSDEMTASYNISTDHPNGEAKHNWK
ncbi:hypothetical protein T11_9071 [Trichinella zimbabwensis]|uniref:Uncharacterized protein n=1 Tax=Trichinella zimbabwensis TaxID=268475 RepID=A0A0V1H845_9BILA|nr:hypothetical protein T11_9071 [Trichinella zimbabwensis]